MPKFPKPQESEPRRYTNGLKRGNEPYKELFNAANLSPGLWVMWRLICVFPQLIAGVLESLSLPFVPSPSPCLTCTHSHSRDQVCSWTHCMQFLQWIVWKGYADREEKCEGMLFNGEISPTPYYRVLRIKKQSNGRTYCRNSTNSICLNNERGNSRRN